MGDIAIPGIFMSTPDISDECLIWPGKLPFIIAYIHAIAAIIAAE